MNAVGRSLLLLLLFCTACTQHRPELFVSPVAVATTDEIAAAFEDGIYVDEVADMPAKVNHYISPVVSSAEYNEALRLTLQRERLLSPDLTSASYRLTPTYVEVTSPFEIGLDNEGFATFQYHLARLPDGPVLFDEQVRARYESHGSLSHLFVALAVGAASGAVTKASGGSFDDATSAAAFDTGFTLGTLDRATITAARSADLSESGPGPADAGKRVVHAMQRAVALNIAMSLRQMLTDETAAR